MDVIEQFRQGYVEYRRLSADRSHRQIKCLREFEAAANKPLVECGAQELRAYLAERCKDEAPTTVAWKLGMLRPFFGWAFDEGLVSAETLMGVQRVKPPAAPMQLPKPYNRNEMRQFWADLDERWPFATELMVQRWRRGRSKYARVYTHAMRLQLEAIIRLALDCGLRRREIFYLSLDDVDPDNMYIAVRNGKGGKQREVPFTMQTRTAVTNWLKFRSELKPKTDSVWLSLKHDTITNPMRFSRFDKLLRTFGDYGLHRLRHTCATEFLRAGMSLEVLQRLLGHSKISMTLRYAAIINDDIYKAVEKAEPAFAEAVSNGGSD